jgi:hypothetical protein
VSKNNVKYVKVKTKEAVEVVEVDTRLAVVIGIRGVVLQPCSPPLAAVSAGEYYSIVPSMTSSRAAAC